MKRTLAVLLLLLAVDAGAEYRIDRLEPAFWWAAMQHELLEIMVHGEGIAELEPAIEHPGVALENVYRTENPNYLFIELKLSGDVNAGRFRIDFKHEGSAVLHREYELRARQAGSAGRAGFDSSDVIYLITPDRFANGDPSNDQVEGLADGLNRDDPYGRHGGDLQGIIDHLDYIGDMGYTQIWLNPVLENDQPEASYHGYATTDFYQVDPRFGSNALYADLSSAAGEKGVGLIMDVILNHCGSEHWWMSDLPTEDWINHGGQFVGTTHKRVSLFDPHGTDSDRKRFNEGWFVPTMPDLNQKNPRLAIYLIQNSIWWIEYAGLSGIRVDTWSYSDKAFLSEWGLRLTEEYPDLNIVGEEWITNPAIVAYWQHGTSRQDGYQSYLPSLMDFPLHDAAIQGFMEEEGWGTGLDRIYRMLANDFLYADPYNLVIFPDNHDMSRIYTQLDERFDLYRMSLVFFLTTRGIPQLYYGDEVLMSNPGTEEHGVIRSDFAGGWRGDPASGFTGHGLTPRQLEAQALTRKLLNWRKSATAIHDGKLTQYAPDGKTYVYFRHNNRQTVMVVINKSSEEQPIDVSRFDELIAGRKSGTDILTGKHYRLDAPLKIPPNTVLLLDLQEPAERHGWRECRSRRSSYLRRATGCPRAVPIPRPGFRRNASQTVASSATLRTLSSSQT
ncbi:MAG: glycoside hydrolase family 13 protein [Woeseiaceae bacterium]